MLVFLFINKNICIYFLFLFLVENILVDFFIDFWEIRISCWYGYIILVIINEKVFVLE